MRAASLDKTLATIAASSYPRRHVQVVIADNAGDADTERVCDRYTGRMKIAYVVERSPGKNAALNAALPVATGDVLLFTDDDVEVAPDWLWETAHAAARWPKHLVFGGRVLPLWPAPFPPHLNDRQYLGVCFSVLDLDQEEGPSFRFTPFGPNLAIRRTVFDAGIRFNPRIGPQRTSYIMGSETELIRRLKGLGYAPVYVPRSVVHHTVRPEQFTDRWLFGRAFRYGRLLEVRRQEEEGKGRLPLLRQAPALLRCVARGGVARLTRARKSYFDHAMELATTCGMIYQSWQRSPAQDGPAPQAVFSAPPQRMRA